MEVCQNKTGRWIVYTTAESKKAQRISSSYVAVMGTTASQTPRFGRIVSRFQHTFAKQTADWVVLDEYTNPMKDSDSKLWKVATNSPITSTVPSKKLSMPLVVAKDPLTAELWFLNFH